jgi:predicted PurR-regulated permease PerM
MIEGQLEGALGISLPLDSFSDELETNMSGMFKPERVFRLIQSASTNIVWIILIVIVSFHLLRDWERLREWFFGLVPEKNEPDLRRLHQEIKHVWRVYLRGQLLIMTILGVVSGVGAAAVGVPGALTLGFLAGALALVPSLGPAAATAIAALVAWTQGSNTLEISNLAVTLIVVAIFQVIQLIEGFWLTPRIMSRRLNLHPGVVLIAIVSTLFTLGALMALIIVPLLGSFVLAAQYVRAKRAGLDPWAAIEENLIVETEGAEVEGV